MTTLTVNGRTITADITPRTHLADFLRETLLLTGTHLGCEHGVCGACTILLDGEPARACIAYAALCDGADIRTIEGLIDDPVTTRLRDAFAAEHALQCGYCTPGMLVTARDIVTRLPDADEARIRLELAGNLCRCTGYDGIVRAIGQVLAERLDVGSARRPAIPTTVFERAAIETTRTEQATDGMHQRLAFPVSADALWEALQNPAEMASCIPGAAIDRIDDGQITGVMKIAIGPIRISFAGQATITYDQAARTGRVSGQGGDKGGTRVSATADFAVAPNEPGALLLVDIDYTLRGALAQLASRRTVDLLAGEIAAQFTRNLQARLSGETTAAAPLRAISVAYRLARLWLLSKLKRR